MAIRQGRKAAGNTLIGGLGGMHTYGCVAQRTSSLHRQCFSSESRGGRPGLSVPNSPYGLCGRKATIEKKKKPICSEFRSCVNAEVAVVGSNSPYGLCVCGQSKVKVSITELKHAHMEHCVQRDTDLVMRT